MNGNHFVKIYDWMIHDLNLSLNEAYVYAIIYSWCTEKDKPFDKTREYLVNCTNLSIRSIQSILDSLTAQNLIEKNTVNRRKIEYKIVKKKVLFLEAQRYIKGEKFAL